MIERYTRREMGAIWTEQNKLQKWLDVELAALDALAHFDYIPKNIPAIVQKKAKFDINRVKEIEKTVQHDIIAFLTNITEHVGKDGRYVHFGLTSSDVLDTGLALQIKQASTILIEDLKNLIAALKVKAKKHKFTLMVGRSHGVHAEPITFGLKMAIFYSEFQRNLIRLERAADNAAYGKISGAVGTFANVPPKVEEYVCAKLGLKPAPISNQVIQRDHHAEYLTTLAIIGGSLEKLAIEIRGLQKTETREVEENFSEGQKGSSAMPHKRNPIVCEKVVGLARLLRGNAMAAIENIALWHERDISHSSVERVIFPDSTILLDHMLVSMSNVITKLCVFPDRMLENMEKSRGMVFSQGLLLKLIEKGLTREDSYKRVQNCAKKVWESKDVFREVVLKDKEIVNFLGRKEIEAVFNYDYHTRHVNEIFKRLGI
ncbi:MAG: adenylosuccinate lyase [Omnitrophica bacterium RIFCSPLOWO2_12_FULL_44_17]|uniref:Adenylosuccinate lyase n=1 Tax=Candidatus Danuiimicrobium aquiferis TaxID=1801832 RepID=A0A1G1KXB8_9BACT|nr:MAG: adenylosuccinate lyase [Omnitrophica bacterium RIFCSPHIGHO2_02_FULL_45_28]OGW90263.1 MAG: adenylosuccinate lyase [Omnitrophica bacterium RIFCSPHIGHO2_12_FULL_44_12]OGW97249.1 MAG: adenylosuccinate lyase [Omnitrophica bacterium RIFCSPLOWO2_12_FULL_44_17]OGX02303.1 MAG: adenylosuccinate lyase [Omnitrophica bacterium RIFCSPLOWO2_02_FULL_44_11]